MLADQLDYVVGVDPHRDTHALAIVEVRTGGVVFETSVAASGEGYAARFGARERAGAGTKGVRG
jgi:transposase